MVNFIIWIVVGAIAGWLAGVVMKSRHGLITNIILGIVGSAVGGFILTLIPGTQSVESGFSLGHILTATVGAIVIIAIARFIRRA
ncbi:MAG: GlsB/YeaQ/YmgE family stress response membrane protein [Anaerolineae bacterium]|nr:GlsB/YeaQ/YmgE family stress response membrane protein [Anaerolineae bacterium]